MLPGELTELSIYAFCYILGTLLIMFSLSIVPQNPMRELGSYIAFVLFFTVPISMIFLALVRDFFREARPKLWYIIFTVILFGLSLCIFWGSAAIVSSLVFFPEKRYEIIFYSFTSAMGLGLLVAWFITLEDISKMESLEDNERVKKPKRKRKRKH